MLLYSLREKRCPTSFNEEILKADFTLFQFIYLYFFTFF